MSAPQEPSGPESERPPATSARDEGQTPASERLRLLEFASGSIAHDLNNLLMVIESSAAQLVTQLEAPSRSQAELILRSTRSAGELVQQLLHVGHRKPAQPQISDLNELLAGSLELLRAVAGQAIQVRFVAGASPAVVFVDPAQIQEVLLNLAVNAREAMASGGELALSTSTESISAGDPDLAPGRYARIHLCDTGLGMSQEAQARAFEPYFTTKQALGNSGLGLATVRDVLRQCQGVIRLSGIRPQGTCFDIFLPIVASPEAALSDPLILLLDDSDELRRLLETFLVSQRYQVMACASGHEMLDQVRSLAHTPQLIIADVLMAGDDGTELVARLRQLHSGLKAIFISGHDRSSEDMPALPSDAHFLQKPFSLQSLSLAIESLLGPSA